jgi:hypothetical protein
VQEARTSNAAQPYGRDPFTRTSQIEIDGKVVGYLVEYQPVPTAVDVQRNLPTGSYLIEDPRFEDVGFISPRGQFFRYLPNSTASTSLGAWPLEEGLRHFYGGGMRIRVTPIEPTAPKPAAPAAAPAKEGEKKEGEGEGTTDEGGK